MSHFRITALVLFIAPLFSCSNLLARPPHPPKLKSKLIFFLSGLFSCLITRVPLYNKCVFKITFEKNYLLRPLYERCNIFFVTSPSYGCPLWYKYFVKLHINIYISRLLYESHMTVQSLSPVSQPSVIHFQDHPSSITLPT